MVKTSFTFWEDPCSSCVKDALRGQDQSQCDQGGPNCSRIGANKRKGRFQRSQVVEGTEIGNSMAWGDGRFCGRREKFGSPIFDVLGAAPGTLRGG